MKDIEILAPAGSISSLKTAINAGCDAVYMGGLNFGARAYADNPDCDNMVEAIRYVHRYGKKIYLTVNTLLNNDEIKHQLFEYLKPFYMSGVDAVIVQDFGVMKFVHDYFEKLPIHASTQMTISSSLAADMLKNFGVTRIVTPRELSFDEINNIKINTKLEIESFIHGALCYCYSGQCLLSSMIGGRSGNRGRCAQPCRKKYKVYDDKYNLIDESYILSPKDMCTLDLIPELYNSGIDSFKIEGRMKKPEYVAITVSTYKKYFDLYKELGDEGYAKYIKTNAKEYHEDKINLMDIYNRGGFTDGYYNRHNGKIMMSSDRPNHMGTLVGNVIEVNQNSCKIKLNNDVSAQDVLEIRSQGREDNYEYTLKEGCLAGIVISTRFNKGLKINKGQRVYRVRNQRLISEIEEKYISNNKKINAKALFSAHVGQNITLQLETEDVSISVQGNVCEKAINRSMEEKDIRKQLNKTGNSDVCFEKLRFDMDENIFITVGSLNDLRRKAISELENKLSDRYGRVFNDNKAYNNKQKECSIEKEEKKDNAMINSKLNIVVSVTNCNMAKMAIEYDVVNTVFLDIVHFSEEELKSAINLINNSEKEVGIILPHILRESNVIYLMEHYSFIFNNIVKYIARNLEGLSLVKNNNANAEVISDYNMYAMNDEAADTLVKMGFSQVSVPMELKDSDIKKLADKNSFIKLYGYINVMTSTGCIRQNTIGCGSGNNEYFELMDEYKKKYRVYNNCRYCYNLIYDSKPINILDYTYEMNKNGFSNFRIDFEYENCEEAKKILDNILQLFGKK